MPEATPEERKILVAGKRQGVGGKDSSGPTDETYFKAVDRYRSLPFPATDSQSRTVGPASLFTAMADGRPVENTLGDSGAQSDFAHPEYCRKKGVPILSLDLLHPSQQVAVKSVSTEGLLPQGFIVQRIQLPGIAAYDEDRIIYVWDEKVAALHNAEDMPLVLGTATLLRAFAVATESELAALSCPLQAARAALMLAGLVPRDKSRGTRCLLQQVRQAEGESFVPRPVVAHREQTVEAYTFRVVYGTIRDPPKSPGTLMTVGVPSAYEGRRMSPVLTTLNTFYDAAGADKVPVVVENNTPMRLVIHAGECIGAVEAVTETQEQDDPQVPLPLKGSPS